MGQENDRKALEMAHVSIGPHESRACIKLFPAGEINGQ
jgi:Ca2+-transporting ATPase